MSWGGVYAYPPPFCKVVSRTDRDKTRKCRVIRHLISRELVPMTCKGPVLTAQNWWSLDATYSVPRQSCRIHNQHPRNLRHSSPHSLPSFSSFPHPSLQHSISLTFKPSHLARINLSTTLCHWKVTQSLYTRAIYHHVLAMRRRRRAYLQLLWRQLLWQLRWPRRMSLLLVLQKHIQPMGRDGWDGWRWSFGRVYWNWL